MPKLKHKQVIVKLNNNSIVIYYSYNGKEMRYPTGISLGKNAGSYMNPITMDNKTGRLKMVNAFFNQKDRVEELNTKQKTIDDLVVKANGIINYYFSKDIIISVDELTSLLTTEQDNRITKANTTFFDYFTNFLEKKKNHFTARGNIISLKDYNSTKRLLEDFQAFKNTVIRVIDVDTHWLQSLVQYMSVKHDEFHGQHKVSSKGEMADSTIKKRLDIVGEFFGYLKELKVVTAQEVDTIKNYKKTIKKQPVHKETLDISEIHSLYTFQFKLKHHQEIRDIFVFLCLTGMRFQDLVDFDKRFIQKLKNGGMVYIKAASKTGINYNIPLCKIVIEVLKKYDFKLPSITDQYGNRIVKEALQLTGMFNGLTQVKDKVTKQYKPRYEAITLHKGRNSFITNLVDITPLNELMKYTGHKKLSTLQGYIDVKRPVKMEYVEIFDMK